MITLLYHARVNGAICRRIQQAGDGKIQAICDKDNALPLRFDGTLVRWDSRLEMEADKTINSAKAVKLSRDKRQSRIVLAELAPKTWFFKRDCQFPCVVRPKRHYGGQNFYLCNTREELVAATRRCGGLGRYYASEFIEKTDEFRVFVINGETFKIVRRYRADANPLVPWNAHNGGLSKRIKPEHWPAGVAEIAEKVAERLKLDLCAVDIIVKGDKQYALEANTAPGLERQGTIRKFAKLLMELA